MLCACVTCACAGVGAVHVHVPFVYYCVGASFYRIASLGSHSPAARHVGWHSQPRLRVELAGAIRRRWPVAAASSLCRRWFSSGKMGRAAARVCTLHGSGRVGACVTVAVCRPAPAARSGRRCQSCRPSAVRLDGTEPPAGTDRSIGLLDGLPRTRVGLHSRILYMWRSDSFVLEYSTRVHVHIDLH